MLAVLKHPENSRQDHDGTHNGGQCQSLSENQIAQQRCEHNTGILIDTDLGGRCLLISIRQQILAANRPTISSIPITLREGTTKPGIIKSPAQTVLNREKWKMMTGALVKRFV